MTPDEIAAEKAQNRASIATHGRGLGPVIRMTLDEIIAEMLIAAAKFDGIPCAPRAQEPPGRVAMPPDGFTVLIGGRGRNFSYNPVALTTHGWGDLATDIRCWNHLILAPVTPKKESAT